MKSILVDMDEVIACYTEKVVGTLKKETGIAIDLKKVEGKFLSQSLPPEIVEMVSSYPYRIFQGSQGYARQSACNETPDGKI